MSQIELLAATLSPGQNIGHGNLRHRHAWAQIICGQVVLNGHIMKAGDGAAINGETEIDIVAADLSELLLFDLA